MFNLVGLFILWWWGTFTLQTTVLKWNNLTASKEDLGADYQPSPAQNELIRSWNKTFSQGLHVEQWLYNIVVSLQELFKCSLERTNPVIINKRGWNKVYRMFLNMAEGGKIHCASNWRHVTIRGLPILHEHDFNVLIRQCFCFKHWYCLIFWDIS